MNRPVSPTSIMSFVDEAQEEIENSFPITAFREAVRIGFDYIKQKINKTLITPGDALNEFLNFNVHDPETDNNLLVPMFSITILLLTRSREALETIQPGIYSSIRNYVSNHFEIKSQEIS